MRKTLTYIIAAIVSIFIMTPPWNINVSCDVNSLMWLWCVALAGLLSFFYLNTKAPWPIKLLVIYAFVGSFFSVAPYWSFMMTIPMVACAYFYLACRKIEDFEVIQQAIQAAFLLICSFLVVQAFGHDTLYNFNRPQPMVVGTIGNKMISATMITCLAPFLITYRRLNIVPLCLVAIMTGSAGMIAALSAGILFYTFTKYKGTRIKILISILLVELLFLSGAPQHAIKSFNAGRGPIWKKTIELSAEHPIHGYGISSYQLVFPALSHDLTVLGVDTGYWEIETLTGHQTPALQTHNCWLQFYFELGQIGMALIYALVIWLVSLYKIKNERTILTMAGLVILGTIMIFHFPTRLWHTVPVFICYLAYYEILMKKEVSLCPARIK